MTDLQDPYGVDDDRTTSPLRGRGFVLSAVLIVLILFAGAVVVTLNVLDDDSEPSGNPPETPSSTSPPADPEASICGLDAVKLTGGLVAKPTDVTWALAGRVALPSSDEHGPGRTDRGRYCFSRTPEGAVLAAASTYGWQTVADLRLALEHSVADGEGKEAARDLLESAPDDTDLTGGALLQIRGFRVVTYTGSSAFVDLAAQGTVEGESTLLHQQFELVWEQGDWKLRMAPDGSAARTEALPDLTGYVPWAGA